MTEWNWQISSCLVMSQVETCVLPSTNYNFKDQWTQVFFNGAWHCGWVRSRWRKCHVIVERATLLRAGCSLDFLGKDWECQPLTTCRPCWTRSLPHPESHSQIFPKHVGLHAEKKQKRQPCKVQGLASGKTKRAGYTYQCIQGIRVKIHVLEGGLQVKLPTIWTDEKQRWEESEKSRAEQRRGEEKRREEERRRSRCAKKVGKPRFTLFFQWFVAPEGRKVCSLKRRVRSHLAGWEMKRSTTLWREAHLQVKKLKQHLTFGALLEIEMSKKCTPLWREAHLEVKLHKTSCSDDFWELRCRKSARRCGAKHIWKSKCTKHTILGPLLEVEMSKKCTPLWREAHFQVKM